MIYFLRHPLATGSVECWVFASSFGAFVQIRARQAGDLSPDSSQRHDLHWQYAAALMYFNTPKFLYTWNGLTVSWEISNNYQIRNGCSTSKGPCACPVQGQCSCFHPGGWWEMLLRFWPGLGARVGSPVALTSSVFMENGNRSLWSHCPKGSEGGSKIGRKLELGFFDL